MTDKIRLASGHLNEFTGAVVKQIIEKKEWMKEVSFTLVRTREEFEKLVDRLIAQGVCSVDLETTSLNTRRDKNGQSIAKLVGVCLAPNSKEGFYVPVNHEDKEYNIPEAFVLRELKRLVMNCRCIFHNFKYDGQVLRNYDIVIEDPDMIEDTFLMVGVQDASQRERGLKELSQKILGREMIEIHELGGKKARGAKKDPVAFHLVPPLIAMYYGGGDAMNTFGLYEYFEAKLNEQDPQRNQGPWTIYSGIEKRCLFPTMDMERNHTRVDREFLKREYDRVEAACNKTVEDIYELAGRKFDIASPKQLGQLLFEELKIVYPEKERTPSGQYITTEATLLKVKDAPIAKLILDYRGYQKIQGTYINNLLQNMDAKQEVKFQLNQLRADTGRYSASGGRGLNEDGYCGVNCQNIPVYDTEEEEKKPANVRSVDIRKAIIARSGYKIVALDYSGEELRIAANFSHEPKWLDEFLDGAGDLHTMTARIIYNKRDVTKVERNVGKRLNFLTIYGGTAVGFSAVAKIPYETAKKMIINFFREYNGLQVWIKHEIARCRRRGYSLTFMGRRRPLKEYYESTDPKIKAKGDRCAINSAVQGTGADVIKIALYRIWKWIYENGFQDDVRMLMPVHDEIVFEIKEDKLDFFIPELCEKMKLQDIVKKLGWAIPLEVDAEYGDSFHTTNDYWKEQAQLQEEPADKTKNENPTSPTSTDSGKQEGTPEQPTDKHSDSDVSVASATSQPVIEGSINTDAQHYHFSVTVRDSMFGKEEKKENVQKVLKTAEEEKDEIDPALQDIRIKDRIDKRGVLIYPLERMDPVTVQQLTTVLKILTRHGTDQFIGPRCKVCFTNTLGEVWYETKEKIPLDALLALCFWLKI